MFQPTKTIENDSMILNEKVDRIKLDDSFVKGCNPLVKTKTRRKNKFMKMHELYILKVHLYLYLFHISKQYLLP